MMAKLKCPGCGCTDGVPAEGGKVVCPDCGGTFTFEAGEGRLAGVAEFDKLKGDVADLQKENAELRKRLDPETPPAEPSADPPEEEEANDDEEDEF